MKSPIIIAKELQQQGMTVSFWFHSCSPNAVEVNVHTTPEKPGGGIKSKTHISPTEKEISRYLLTFLN